MARQGLHVNKTIVREMKVNLLSEVSGVVEQLRDEMRKLNFELVRFEVVVIPNQFYYEVYTKWYDKGVQLPVLEPKAAPITYP